MRYPIKNTAIWSQGYYLNTNADWIFDSSFAMFLSPYTKLERKDIAKRSNYKFGFVITKLNNK